MNALPKGDEMAGRFQCARYVDNVTSKSFQFSCCRNLADETGRYDVGAEAW